MRIVDFDELPAGWERKAQMLDASAGWMPLGFRRVKEARRLGYPAAPYLGVYAVEDGEVKSVVRVRRVPYTMAGGRTETVSAIEGVATRREWSRRGLARELLREVHRREAESGSRVVLLWTGHSNMAHNLYESIGYRDVYTPMLAMKWCGQRKSGPRGYDLRPLRAGDERAIEDLHLAATKGRLGFTPRPKGILNALLKLGMAKRGMFRVVTRRREPVGYAQVIKEKDWARSDEVVLAPGARPEEAVLRLESECAGRWLILLGTFVRDSAPVLRRRGYSFTSGLYSGMLACGLRDNGRALDELGTDDRSFTCHFLDYF